MEPEVSEQSFTPADRIKQLNDIDKDVTKLLHSAGLAIQALTNSAPKATADSGHPASNSGSLESHREAFSAAASQYLALLQSIDVRLRRQVYALEEASIIPPESNAKTNETVGTGTAGGANPLEISWLNSRKDSVGKDKEALLWAEARKFAEVLQSRSPEAYGNNTAATDANEGNSQKMEVD